MSLDKFLTGKPSKKKKKSDKSLDTTPKGSSTSTPTIQQPSEEKLTEFDASSPNDSSPEPLPAVDTLEPVVNTSPTELVSTDLDDSISIDEFKNKSKSQLVEIIQDLIHSSSSYSRNKNLLAQLVADQKTDLNPEVLAEQLEISYYEVIVLLDEIKRDFS